MLGAGDEFIAERTIARGHRIVWRALKYRQVFGLLGDDRHGLYPRRPGADQPDPHAGKIHAVGRPLSGVVNRTLEVILPGNFRCVRHRQAAGGHDAETGIEPGAIFGGDQPATGLLIEVGGNHPGVEIDVGTEIEAVGDVIGVAENFRLGRHDLSPVPFLLEFFGKTIGVFDARDVAASAWIAIPVPGASDVTSSFDRADGQSGSAKTVQRVHAAEPGADDDHVDVSCRCACCFICCTRCRTHECPLCSKC